MISNVSWGLMVGLVLGAGCETLQTTDESRAEPAAHRLDHAPKAIREVIEAIRDRKLSPRIRLWPFRKWLKATLRSGRTTRAEIVALLGSPHENLDRPKRDGVETLQYVVTRDLFGGFARLVITLKAATGVLWRWSISEAICGFCPHVFADDGRWRLEGKLLAGRVGAQREGGDTVVLPRLRRRGKHVRVNIANIAPEVEHLDEVRLGAVAVPAGASADLDVDGEFVVWKEAARLRVDSTRDGATLLGLPELPVRPLLVLELFNDGEFEAAMRRSIGGDGPLTEVASLWVVGDTGLIGEIEAVGTKMLRRVVLPLSGPTRRIQLYSLPGFWSVHRAWVGSQVATPPVRWRAGVAEDHPRSVSRRLQERDGRRLRIEPGESVTLRFRAPAGAVAYALRAVGYYELLRPWGRSRGRNGAARTSNAP